MSTHTSTLFLQAIDNAKTETQDSNYRQGASSVIDGINLWLNPDEDNIIKAKQLPVVEAFAAYLEVVLDTKLRKTKKRKVMNMLDDLEQAVKEYDSKVTTYNESKH